MVLPFLFQCLVESTNGDAAVEQLLSGGFDYPTSVKEFHIYSFKFLFGGEMVRPSTLTEIGGERGFNADRLKLLDGANSGRAGAYPDRILLFNAVFNMLRGHVLS
jgi:hypothetical protein